MESKERYFVVNDNGGGLSIYTVIDGKVILARDENDMVYSPDDVLDDCLVLQEGFDDSESAIIAELSEGDWDFGEFIATYPARAGRAGLDWLREKGVDVSDF